MNRLPVGPQARAAGLLLSLGAVAACGPPPPERVNGGERSGVVASFDGVPIRYDVHGDASPAVVLVHGWSCDRGYWEQQVGPLSARYRVVTVDLGGHGESGLDRDEWTIASFGEDVAAVVKRLDLRAVVLVGHSMGGDVVVQAARRLPGRVRALIWVDTYKRLDTPLTDEEIQDLVEQLSADFAGTTNRFVRGMFPPEADAALVDRVATDMASAPPDVGISAVDSSFRHARVVPEALQEIALPVVALNPDDPPTDRASMARHGVDVVIMPGVGHFMMMEDPERFNALLVDVIDGLP